MSPYFWIFLVLNIILLAVLITLVILYVYHHSSSHNNATFTPDSTPTTNYYDCENGSCVKKDGGPYTTSNCNNECTTTSSGFKGINLAGFDSGNSTTLSGASYSCVSNAQIDWAIQSGMNMFRLPIIPAYIFKTPPSGSTIYSDSLFSSIWTNASTTNTCQSSNPWNNSSYIQAVQYALDQGVPVIIDAHENQWHLCTFDNNPMSSEVFVNMWELIAEYVIRNVRHHEKVYFELFNEPVQDNCEDMATLTWNEKYVVAAIQAIRNVENRLQSEKHWIITTTWGNWSGVHAWVEDDTLPELADTLAKNNFNSSESSRILIAGHQYCDKFDGYGNTIYYSGIGKNCDPSKFNDTFYNEWIRATDEVLGPKNLKWIMTEGNVNCGYDESCTQGFLYVEWLRAILASSTCVGFTVWMSNTGSDYQGADMGCGPGCSNDAKYFKAYSTVYPVQPTTTEYDFSKI